MLIALIKSINWVRTLLRVLVIWHLLSHKTGWAFWGGWGETKEGRERKERTVTEVKTGTEERKLTADNLSDLLVGYRSKGWSTRERKGERDSDRERQISVVPLRADLELICLVTATSVLIINLSWVHSHSHTHTLTHTLGRKKHSTQTYACTPTHSTQTHHQHLPLVLWLWGPPCPQDPLETIGDATRNRVTVNRAGVCRCTSTRQRTHPSTLTHTENMTLQLRILWLKM